MPKHFQSIFTITIEGYILLNNSNYDYNSDSFLIGLIEKYKKVILGDEFNAPIPFITYGITHLIIGKRFNQPLDNLPSTLKYLRIGAIGDRWFSEFNKSLNYLPHGLEELHLYGINCSSIYDDNSILSLPPTLKKLYMDIDYVKFNINLLPDNLEELLLVIPSGCYKDISKLPSNLKRFLYVSECYREITIIKQLFPNIEFQVVGISNYWTTEQTYN